MLNLIYITLFLFSQSEAFSSAATQPSVSPLLGVEAPILSEEYILMPGDGLLVTLSGKITYSYNTAITYEGKVFITIPEVGIVDAVKISGLTLKEGEDSLGRVFRRYYKEVKVKLTLTNLRSIVVFVTGEVLNPGSYNASPIERVSHVISRAGGLTPLGAKRNIKLFRKDNLFATIDLEKFEAEGDISNNPFLESGDRIHVPPRIGSVIVKGAVFGRGEYRLRYATLTGEREKLSEGAYELSPGERVSDLISRAGGITPWADLEAAYLERKERKTGEKAKIALRLSEIIENPNSPYNIELRDEDVIIVPSIKTDVYVQGEVTTPGSYSFFPNHRVSDYVGKAGGVTHYANWREGYIQRGTKRISLKDDPLIEPGDKIFIPRVSIKWWEDYVTILSAFSPFAASIAYLLIIK